MPIRSSEADTFAEQLAPLVQGVTGYLARLLGDADEAQDVWQETQLRASERRDQLQEGGSLRAWVYSIARRLAVDALRKRRTFDDVEALDDLPEAPPRDPTQEAVRTTNKATLRELVDELPELEKTLVVLRVDRKLEWKEIAEVLGTTPTDEPMTPGNASKMYGRVTKRLRKAFAARGALPTPDGDDA